MCVWLKKKKKCYSQTSGVCVCVDRIYSLGLRDRLCDGGVCGVGE